MPRTSTLPAVPNTANRLGPRPAADSDRSPALGASREVSKRAWVCLEWSAGRVTLPGLQRRSPLYLPVHVRAEALPPGRGHNARWSSRAIRRTESSASPGPSVTAALMAHEAQFGRLSDLGREPREGRMRRLPSGLAAHAGLLAAALGPARCEGARPQGARHVPWVWSEGAGRRFDQVAARGRLSMKATAGGENLTDGIRG